MLRFHDRSCSTDGALLSQIEVTVSQQRDAWPAWLAAAGWGWHGVVWGAEQLDVGMRQPTLLDSRHFTVLWLLCWHIVAALVLTHGPDIVHEVPRVFKPRYFIHGLRDNRCLRFIHRQLECSPHRLRCGEVPRVFIPRYFTHGFFRLPRLLLNIARLSLSILMGMLIMECAVFPPGGGAGMVHVGRVNIGAGMF